MSGAQLAEKRMKALGRAAPEKIADVTHNTPPEKSYYRVFTARLSGYGKYRRGYLPPITSSSRLTNRAKKGKISRVNLNGFCGVCPSVGRRAATMFLREAPRIESRKSISRKQTKKHNTTGCGAVGSAGGLGPSGRRFDPCHSDQNFDRKQSLFSTFGHFLCLFRRFTATS